MICILAGNYHEAQTFAHGQNLDKEEWFYPKDMLDLEFKSNFHVLVIGTAGHNLPSMLWERIYNKAMERGKIGRK